MYPVRPDLSALSLEIAYVPYPPSSLTCQHCSLRPAPHLCLTLRRCLDPSLAVPTFTHCLDLHPLPRPSPTTLNFTHCTDLHPLSRPSPTASTFTHFLDCLPTASTFIHCLDRHSLPRPSSTASHPLLHLHSPPRSLSRRDSPALSITRRPFRSKSRVQ